MAELLCPYVVDQLCAWQQSRLCGIMSYGGGAVENLSLLMQVLASPRTIVEAMAGEPGNDANVSLRWRAMLVSLPQAIGSFQANAHDVLPGMQ